MPSLHLQAKFDALRNLPRCTVSPKWWFERPLWFHHVPHSGYHHVCARLQLWHNPRRSNRAHSNLVSVLAKRSDHPDQSICLENIHPEFLVLCENNAQELHRAENQCFPLEEECHPRKSVTNSQWNHMFFHWGVPEISIWK